MLGLTGGSVAIGCVLLSCVGGLKVVVVVEGVVAVVALGVVSGRLGGPSLEPTIV